MKILIFALLLMGSFVVSATEQEKQFTVSVTVLDICHIDTTKTDVMSKCSNEEHPQFTTYQPYTYIDTKGINQTGQVVKIIF